MMDFREMVLHESAHSGLVFHDRAYDKGRYEELVVDVVALANASVTGPRFIVLGVDIADGNSRRVVGVTQDQVAALKKMLPRIAARIVEPSLRLELRETEVNEAGVAIIVVDDCSDPPYLLRREISGVMHAGRGWIRRGTQTHPLLREDLQRMLERPKVATDRIAELTLGFPGKVLSEEISLPVLPLDEKPSLVAARRLQKMLEGNASARDVLGRTETQFSRLLHAQVFGSDLQFEKHSDESLIERLNLVEQEHAAADEYYEFEARAHRLQLEIRNGSDFEIEQAVVSLTFHRFDGIGIAEHIYTRAGEPEVGPGRYPLVDAASKRYIVQARTGRIRAGGSTPAFREPLRLLLREPAAGRTLLIDYKLQCRDLSRPVSGTLRIGVEAVRRQADARRELRTGTD